MKSEPGEGKAHEMKESPEDEIREGSESEEGHYGKTNRKRSARGAKHTKAPMDAEGCACGSKGRKGKAACDGSCGKAMKDGGYSKKMDRNDVLTPQEYLAACDLGIHQRNRAYIRARLDAERRFDKKCGASGIPDNAKCNKAQGTSAMNNAGGTKRKPSIRSGAMKGAKVGALIGGGLGLAKGIIGGATMDPELGTGSRVQNSLLGAAGGTLFGAAGGALQGTVIGGTINAGRKVFSSRGSRKKDSVWANGFAP